MRRDDGTLTEEQVQEVYKAVRPKDEAEREQWAEEYYANVIEATYELTKWAQDYKVKRLASGCKTHKEFMATGFQFNMSD